MKKIIYSSILVCITNMLVAQSESNILKPIFPIGDNPSIGYKTSMVSDLEKIIFEANPIIRMPIYNNIRPKIESKACSGSSFYIPFKPQFRMYNDNSKPVKMPSYIIGLGYQSLFRISDLKTEKKYKMLAVMIESGHYSNGQNFAAFNNNALDGSDEAKAAYASLNANSNLSDLLNRDNGNFSTNFTELGIKYFLYPNLDDNYIPKSGWSFEGGYNRFHNFLLFAFDIGGYSEEDIKIYGKNRWNLGVEYFSHLNQKDIFFHYLGLDRISFKSSINYINKPHPFVQPLRVETTGTMYFKNDLGIFISGIFGHDNYNYRFVDHGPQLFIGIIFDKFPPFPIK